MDERWRRCRRSRWMRGGGGIEGAAGGEVEEMEQKEVEEGESYLLPPIPSGSMFPVKNRQKPVNRPAQINLAYSRLN